MFLFRVSFVVEVVFDLGVRNASRSGWSREVVVESSCREFGFGFCLVMIRMLVCVFISWVGRNSYF